ncbi:LLM class flavin-dependent oxidoreductase [Nocardioides sp. zg-536]|uniref:LLM class flavin-dependent oxidoreductase n=1 Tax=Nocardioides faecalis TaxID=2803858 RepID=A0A938Y8F0_9ACTN|nr:LLM class flavin-dependent oxidoreductase [Nocardioides faecalis]MBM9461195.1 LLM class flavin-dependent oxidoreductase [Nocardioides faecalis]MBS4752152.1 LLM class flavin-dependent oxidoreductase [Nocardioides faecalis]QVI59043.1 LLM class flavin-dependent oxidoreductase [Nocardioides faecalis]
MKFGIMASHQYPHEEDLRAHLSDLFGTVELAAELGYDSVWTINHFQSNLATPQPISMIASLIPRTGDMTIGTGILLLPLFHPAHVAEEFATLDQLSGGRVVLGVGAGYRENEFAAFGIDPATRFGRLDESLRLIRELWTGEPVTFSGKHFSLEDASIGVRPLTPGGPPVWVGAGGTKAVRRAARLGDAWYAPGNSPNPSFLPDHVAVYDAALLEAGKDPATVERPVGVELYCAPTTEQAVAEALPHARREYSTYAEYPALRWQRDRFDELVVNTLLLGSPEDLVRRIGELREVGFNHLIFRPGWLGMPPEKVRASLRLFAEEVFPAFR